MVSKMMYQTIEQTMQDSYRGVRERLGMAYRSPVVRMAAMVALQPPEPVSDDDRETKLLSPVLEVAQTQTWKEILKETSEKHGIPFHEFMGNSRTKKIVDARKEAAYRLVTEKFMSYPAIARRMAYGDHSSVLYLVHTYAKSIGVELTHSKTILGKARDERNEKIMARLYAGETVSEISKDYELTGGGIRSVAHAKGFVFKVGAEKRTDRALEVRRAADNERKNSIKAARKAKADDARAKAMQREKVATQYLAEQCYSYAEASRLAGVCETTMRRRADKHGIKFRNPDIAKAVVIEPAKVRNSRAKKYGPTKATIEALEAMGK